MLASATAAATPPTVKDLSLFSPEIVYTPINIEEKKRLQNEKNKLLQTENDSNNIFPEILK
jgi:hypothetical protein